MLRGSTGSGYGDLCVLLRCGCLPLLGGLKRLQNRGQDQGSGELRCPHTGMLICCVHVLKSCLRNLVHTAGANEAAIMLKPVTSQTQSTPRPQAFHPQAGPLQPMHASPCKPCGRPEWQRIWLRKPSMSKTPSVTHLAFVWLHAGVQLTWLKTSSMSKSPYA